MSFVAEDAYIALSKSNWFCCSQNLECVFVVTGSDLKPELERSIQLGYSDLFGSDWFLN